MLTSKEATWTLIVVSNDPLIMAACDRVVYLEDGEVTANGPFEEIINTESIVKNIY
jgi:ABC-type cobalamin/Fe3+-siderophores transport system ATPase subunit